MDFINIIGTFFDNSIEHVVALAHQIKDLRLNRNQQDINEDIYKEVDKLKEEDIKINQKIVTINSEIDEINNDLEGIHQDIQNVNDKVDSNVERIDNKIDSNVERIDENLRSIEDTNSRQDEADNEFREEIQNINQDTQRIDVRLDQVNQETQRLGQRVAQIEEGNVDFLPKDTFRHKLITASSYHNLAYYEKDVLYLVVDSFNEETSVFGDTFPLILGGSFEPSHFGDKFPIILDGDNDSQYSHFGDKFPLIFGDANYYIGSRFPIVFKH